MDCSFCNDPIEPGQESRTFRLVKGWVRSRGAKGGANHVVVSTDLGERAHVSCVNLARAGAEADQLTFG